MVGNAEESEESDVSDDTDSDDDNIDAEEIADVGEENKKKAKPDEEEEDDLIKALKATREKKVRNSPPDIKLNCMGTVRSGTKLVVNSGTGPLYLFRWIFLLSTVVHRTPVSPSRCPTKLVS